jgi:concentrative nucleoside transporter, CNT family
MTEALTLQGILGLIFAPVAWMMGIEGWHDSRLFGSLLGTKLALNEFVAFDSLARLLPGSEGAAFANERSGLMAAYALCGFANIGSVGIQLGGITPLAPGRRTEISQLALRAMLGGAFASFMTATIAGAMLF